MDHPGLSIVSCQQFIRISDHFMQRSQPDSHLFIWVVGGRGFAQTQGQRCDVGAGSLLTFRRGDSHAYGSDPHDPWSILWFHFDGPASQEVVREVRGAMGRVVLPLALDEPLRERWLEMIATFHTPSPGGPSLANYLLWGVIGLIRHRLSVGPAGQHSAVWQVTQVVQRYVRNHLPEPMRVEDLARAARLSPRQLTRIMRETMGCSPMAYVIDQRLAQAAAMLRQTPRPIKQVASAVGYDDEYYFSRLFKRHMGVSPTAYRQAGETGREADRERAE